MFFMVDWLKNSTLIENYWLSLTVAHVSRIWVTLSSIAEYKRVKKRLVCIGTTIVKLDPLKLNMYLRSEELMIGGGGPIWSMKKKKKRIREDNSFYSYSLCDAIILNLNEKWKWNGKRNQIHLRHFRSCCNFLRQFSVLL